jgi:hypothetical protein
MHCGPRPVIGDLSSCNVAVGLRRAELIASGVLHDPPASCRSLIDLAYAGCPQLLQPGNQLIEALGLTVDVDVQAVLAGLPLRNLPPRRCDLRPAAAR